MYDFQQQNSEQTLREGLEEFYSINTQFRDLVEKDSPNAYIFKEHDYTHVLFGLGTSIEEESILDTYVIWGMKFDWGKIINFYKDQEYKEVIGDIVKKHGGYWGIFKIYMSLMPIKLRAIFRCLKMKKKWNYHEISDEMLNTKLCDLREEYNIVLMPLKYIPINRYNSKST
ncbi:MAG: hypothetical protein CMB29_00590 [Euryarchaeota archaeon]|nr:hypothetical protein [Euryarchaeota archaeon]|tara:strand:+ start:68 stop:580 length:513 start_codon:yes stop_codon:yes gene_type:complete